MTTKPTNPQPPRKARAKGTDEPEPNKLPGVPSHLQAAVQQLIGVDASTSKPARRTSR